MKKSLIALAVAGAMTAPIVAQADATLYGNVEVELIMGDDTGVDLTAATDADAGYTGASDADLQVDDTILGVKGSSELENLSGVEAFYQLEVEFASNKNFDSSTDTGEVATRKALVGLDGGFGTLIFGRQNILAESVERMDKYAESFSTNQYFAFNDRVGNAASYVTPNFGGFEAYGQIVVDGEGDEDRDDVDGGIVGFNYSLGGFDLAAAYSEMDQMNADTMEVYGVGLGWAIAGLQLDATYEATEDNETGEESDMWGLGAAYALGDATIGATYMDFEYDDSGVESDEWGVYASYALGRKASVKAQYTSADVDGNSLENDDFDKFVLGYNVSF
ncbi:major outer membrane protein P.IB [Marinobacterium nitratireducens]|uniref:Major outer membrane protein P.IB n=1 Tax=Marinobacterium nitratireducens TaxID=518897 RepID=A0A917ZFN7_9GAMM|nr:porin [Marinobacterium nitratireducens]GGO81144.1 major outer membrane protein P.IB [Marinobacterium nitratireducens]